MELEFAAYGWEGANWDAAYPDDLPSEWRLDYYGNVFSAVVVPASDWKAASIDEARQWLAEAPRGFRFYWELEDAADATRLLELLDGADGDAEKLAGWLFRSGFRPEQGLLKRLNAVLPGAAYGDAPVPQVQTEHLAAEGITLCWQDGYTLNCRGNGLRVLQVCASPDLRQLRNSVQEQEAAGAQRLMLLLRPEAASASLMQELETFTTLLNG